MPETADDTVQITQAEYLRLKQTVDQLQIRIRSFCSLQEMLHDREKEIHILSQTSREYEAAYHDSEERLANLVRLHLQQSMKLHKAKTVEDDLNLDDTETNIHLEWEADAGTGKSPILTTESGNVYSSISGVSQYYASLEFGNTAKSFVEDECIGVSSDIDSDVDLEKIQQDAEPEKETQDMPLTSKSVERHDSNNSICNRMNLSGATNSTHSEIAKKYVNDQNFNISTGNQYPKIDEETVTSPVTKNDDVKHVDRIHVAALQTSNRLNDNKSLNNEQPPPTILSAPSSSGRTLRYEKVFLEQADISLTEPSSFNVPATIYPSLSCESPSRLRHPHIEMNIAEYERLVSQLQAKLSEKEAMVEHLNGQVQLSMITSNNERSLLIQRIFSLEKDLCTQQVLLNVLSKKSDSQIATGRDKPGPVPTSDSSTQTNMTSFELYSSDMKLLSSENKKMKIENQQLQYENRKITATHNTQINKYEDALTRWENEVDKLKKYNEELHSKYSANTAELVKLRQAIHLEDYNRKHLGRESPRKKPESDPFTPSNHAEVTKPSQHHLAKPSRACATAVGTPWSSIDYRHNTSHLLSDGRCISSPSQVKSQIPTCFTTESNYTSPDVYNMTSNQRRNPSGKFFSPDKTQMHVKPPNYWKCEHCGQVFPLAEKEKYENHQRGCID